MRINLPIFFILFIIIDSCSKKDPIGKDEYTGFYYEQTKCSDPWETGNTASMTLNNVGAYLSEQGLYIGSLVIKQTGSTDTCVACTCKTGKTIYVITLNNDYLKSKYANLGFKPQ